APRPLPHTGIAIAPLSPQCTAVRSGMADDQMGAGRREQPDAPDRKGFGDDQGTRIGQPTPGRPDEPGHLSGKTGAGSEAAEGIHGAEGDREEKEG
ncbi:MAG TPA: hypothetical protein VJV22_06585, partial [Acidobacteriaceae bacterium]|nr:hypothetical protein [Acidobacteriaceae bacterium]